MSQVQLKIYSINKDEIVEGEIESRRSKGSGVRGVGGLGSRVEGGSIW